MRNDRGSDLRGYCDADNVIHIRHAQNLSSQSRNGLLVSIALNLVLFIVMMAIVVPLGLLAWLFYVLPSRLEKLVR